MKEEPEFLPMTVRFKSGIRTDSAIYWVTIEQNGNDIVLTERQALTLADQITKRKKG
jgi:hypothetical protein